MILSLTKEYKIAKQEEEDFYNSTSVVCMLLLFLVDFWDILAKPYPSSSLGLKIIRKSLNPKKKWHGLN